jgi:hypothetical protein
VEALHFNPIVNVCLEDLAFVALVGVMIVAKEHSHKEFTGE